MCIDVALTYWQPSTPWPEQEKVVEAHSSPTTTLTIEVVEGLGLNDVLLVGRWHIGNDP